MNDEGIIYGYKMEEHNIDKVKLKKPVCGIRYLTCLIGNEYLYSSKSRSKAICA